MSQRLEYQRQINKMNRLESGHRRGLIQAKNKIRDIVIKQFQNAVELNPRIDYGQLLNAHEEDIQVELVKMYRKTIPEFGDYVEQGLKERETRQTREFYNNLIQRYITFVGGVNIKEISKTTLDDLRRLIAKLEAEGMGTRQIATRLKALGTLNAFRSRVIARTEVHAAANYASIETARDLSRQTGAELLKKWVPAMDARTRDVHADMINHPAIPIKERFDVGGRKMDRPGDPAGGAANVCNCRCVVQYIDPEYQID